jgi:hypothetical protein
LDPSGPAASLTALALIVITVGYVLTCAAWPFGNCRRCHGTGKIRGPVGGIRYCRRCDHTGLRIRWGRHLWNEIRHIHRDIR